MTRLVEQLRKHAAIADKTGRPHCNLLLEAADAIERAPRWRDVVEELPQEAQEVLFVRGGKTVHGAWIGGIFWHNNQKMAAAKWMPLPLPPNAELRGASQLAGAASLSNDVLEHTADKEKA